MEDDVPNLLQIRDALFPAGVVLKTVLLLAVVGAFLGVAGAQTPPPRKQAARPAATGTAPATEADAEQLAATRKDMIDLLRMSPKMASFVKRDPLLLSDQE